MSESTAFGVGSTMSMRRLCVRISKCSRLSLYLCVIRSPHKYKDSREHFEMRTHKRLIDIVDPTPKAVDSLMRLDLPADVNIEIKL